MQVLISKVRFFFLYRQIVTSQIFQGFLTASHAGVVGFLKEVCYYIEFQCLMSFFAAPDINV